MKKLLQALSLCTIVLFSATVFSCSNSVSTNKSDGNSSQEQGNGQGEGQGEGQGSEQGGGQGSSETSPYNTENEIIQQILSMTQSGTIKITGEITQSLITDIATALKELYKKNDSIRVNLDMGESFGIKTIGTKFSELQNLESIILPNGITNISDESFEYCSNLKSLVIQEGVNKITSEFFRRNLSLETITLPASLQSLPDSFGSDLNSNNSNLKNIIINVENPYLKVVDGVIYNNDMTKLYFYPKTKTDNTFTISTDLQGQYSFKNIDNTYLKELIISGNPNFYEMYLWNCPNLNTLKFDKKNIDLSSISSPPGYIKTIVLSPSVESIEFPLRVDHCLYFFHLTDIIVDENNNNLKSIDGILYSKDESKLIYCPEGKLLETFEFSENVKTIGSWSFSSTALTELNIPGTVETIEEYAFSYCQNLEKVTLAEGNKNIEEGAFVGSYYINTFIIPKTMNKLGKYCFGFGYKKLYFTGTEEEWNLIEKDEPFDEDYSNNKIVFNYSAESNE